MKAKFNIKKVKMEFIKKGIIRCELCNTDRWLSFAHRLKRRHYINKGNLINDFNELLLLCVPCHAMLEKDKNLTEKTFTRLRGKDNGTK